MEKTNLALPEWAWVDGSSHEEGGNPLQGRNIILHIRSASVMEVLESDLCVLNEDVIKYGFNYINSFGLVEPLVVALHHSPLLDLEEDREVITDILRKCSEWYCNYCDWEDENIVEEEISKLN